MRWSPVLLYLGVVIFILSAASILISLERESTVFALIGGIGNAVAGLFFVLSVWLPRKRVDWDRIQAEQRLWESGPLGRRWLRIRRRLYSRWRP